MQPPDNFSVDSRRQSILHQLNKRGKVKVAELHRQFDVSEVTIRNDLKELESAGLLERVHGGAVTTNKAYFNMNFSERISQYQDEKRAVAKAAAEHIIPGDTLMINSGTTTYFISQELKRLSSLTVVTNSVMIAQELSPFNQFNVLLLGGNYNSRYQFTYGNIAEEQIRNYKTDKVILSADGVSFARGLTTHHHQEAPISRLMLERAEEVYLVADYTKIGAENFAHIAPLKQSDLIITNHNANPDELALMKEHQITVQLV